MAVRPPITHNCVPGAVMVDSFITNLIGANQVPLKVTSARQQR
jgi:hypothetical protein